MKRSAAMIYGVFCYAMFNGVFLYSVGFIGNFGVPTALDGPTRTSLPRALAINGLLLAIFVLQHSGMARPAFKRWWTKLVPQPIERSTYVLFSNLAMILMFVFWEPLGGSVWVVQHQAARIAILALYGVGWLTVLYSTMLLNHFELFGLRQAYLYWRGRPYEPLPFNEPSLYRYVRHPLYVGWLLVIWCTNTMTWSHLLFAVGASLYILAAIQLEERDLETALPEYAAYKRRVPMLVPIWPRHRGKSRPATGGQLLRRIF